MRTAVATLVFLLLGWPPVYAQTAIDKLTPALPTAGERQAAEVASWGTAIADVGLDTWASWRAPDRRRAFVLEGTRIGLTYGVVYLVKRAVHRSRPCAPDDCGIDDPASSFYSAHTALAFSTIGGARLTFTLPLAIGTGAGRIAARKHWLTDTLVGAGAGLLTSRIR